MSSLKASPQQLQRIRQTRSERGWAIDCDEWLIAASNILQPEIDWSKAEKFAVSIGTWKRFLAGKPIRPQIYRAFCQVLELDWQETISTMSPTALAIEKIVTDCIKLIAKQYSIDLPETTLAKNITVAIEQSQILSIK